MSEPFIRLAVEADLPRLPDIELSAAKTFLGTRHDRAGATAHFTPAEDWRDILAAGTLWVMDGGDARPIAFLAAEPGDDGALHVDEFDVEQGHQGQGLGRRLISHVIDWARRAGYRALTLTTFNDIPWNGPFYASLNFRELNAVELTPRLASILAEEQTRHLPGSRCAMRLDLQRIGGA